ncbi:response regulator [Lichenibacterium ramalinae]|uniref:Regulatory protein VirG n=1 Tax=Lichenibacterium ramalinae TaxID=2316527 RepID=A0A4Q2RKJ9_9HYPH|nr:response regulator [Lichenibacterium ramalinae]RYB07803.1 response regulator [Lichenibacterium ramalinae]
MTPVDDPLVLIVEDDADISALMARYLGDNGFSTEIAGDGVAMDRRMAQRRPDIVVLDINLPGEDGLSLCLRLRNAGGPPVIMVTAKGEDVDRILGLEMGADDYLPKPFNPRELLARIRAVLRRQGVGPGPAPAAGPPRVLRFAGWTIDRGARRLTDPDGTRVALTSAEFDLLSTFCDHPGRVLSRERLLDLTQGPGSVSQDRSIDIVVSRLRLKIERNPREPDFVQTVRSSGYIFSPGVEAEP